MHWWQIRKRNADLERELKSDLDLEEEDQRDRGLSPEQARYAARRAFGNTALIREHSHEAWGVAGAERFWQDVRYALRQLRRSPRFTLAALLTLALGTGANTAMFSVIHSVLLKSWPFPDSGRLVVVSQRQANGIANLFSTQDFLDWKRQGGLLSGMAVHVSWQFNLSAAGTQPERVAGAEISHEWVSTLGVEPMLGRSFAAQEDVAGSGNFVVLSSALWHDRYGADPQIVGKPILLDGTPHTVLGIMPANFNGFDGKELLWTPLQLQAGSGVGSSPNIHWLTGLIRLPDAFPTRFAR